jgi:uncharacterized protein (UPF0212 family)
MSVVENAARDLLRLHVLVQGYPDRLKQVCASCQQDYPCDTAIAALAALEVDTLTAERDAARAAGEQVRVLREVAERLQWVTTAPGYDTCPECGYTKECEHQFGCQVGAALALTPTTAEQRVTRLEAVEAAIPELLAARAELADASGWDIDRLYAAIDQLAAAAGTGEVGA